MPKPPTDASLQHSAFPAEPKFADAMLCKTCYIVSASDTHVCLHHLSLPWKSDVPSLLWHLNLARKQANVLLPEFTVEQMLLYTTEPKLSSSVSYQVRVPRIEDVVRVLESCEPRTNENEWTS